MVNKMIATAAFLVASTAFATATSVVYTFNLDDSNVPAGVTENISANNITTSDPAFTKDLSVFNPGATLTVTFGKGSLDKPSTDFDSSALSTLAGNSAATELLSTAGINATDLTKINTGVYLNTDTSWVQFKLNGLQANTAYTITMLVLPNGENMQFDINWKREEDRPTPAESTKFTGGSYVLGGNSATPITNNEGELQLGAASIVALNFTTNENGEYSEESMIEISLIQNTSRSSSTALGLFAITGPAVPEPSTFGLLVSIGAIALAVARRKRRSR